MVKHPMADRCVCHQRRRLETADEKGSSDNELELILCPRHPISVTLRQFATVPETSLSQGQKH